ncbi:galactose oxidase [Saccharata proteae CBS 121410]|uniref:Galactose oxidase n=1 Tax=Saccharata proteae CBS 121410 TaxID=1314787 RepID=A0A9P4HRP6_9PEZI|nr:galactose oxidase [Saccharata proteae CBS 121410]
MEIAAGAVVAEQVVSTTVEAGAVAGVAIAQRTMPLKATFTRVAVSDSISRYRHSVTVVGGKAYIFGGLKGPGELTGNEVHVITLPSKATAKHNEIEYHCVPAIPAEEGGSVPHPRASHSACLQGDRIIITGGFDEKEMSLKEPGLVWFFDTTTLKWSSRSYESSMPASPFDHGTAFHKDSLLTYGGMVRTENVSEGAAVPTLTSLNLKTGQFVIHKDQTISPVSFPSTIALVNNQVYVVGGEGKFDSSVHYYDIPSRPSDPTDWKTVPVPSNPLVPGPKSPRDGAGLIRVSTGHGRNYLLYFFGQERGANKTEIDGPEKGVFCTDLWTFQVPSSGISLANVKDGARDKLGMDSGCGSWGEVEVLPHKEEFAHEGKVHPGPRTFFGSSAVDDSSIFLWGGLDPNGDVQGDGWIIKVE